MKFIMLVFLLLAAGCANIIEHPVDQTEFLQGCDRFRPIFEENLEKYPDLKELGLPLIYSLAYQESLCQTAEEMKYYLEAQGSNDSRWQGGIMQVDACWRWGAPYNCTAIKSQISYGMLELSKNYHVVKSEAAAAGIELTQREAQTLLLLGYNRGNYLIRDTLQLLALKKATGSFASASVIMKDDAVTVHVICTEKDVCIGDRTLVDVSAEFNALETDFDKAMLLACKMNYGTMHDSQGDYCIGKGYGLNYPKDVLAIADAANQKP